MNIQNLTININKKTFQTITANVGEVASRFVRINIVDESIPVDLTGVTVSIYAKKPDGNKVFNNVTIEDKTNGIVLAELTSQILATEGLVKLTLLLVKNGGKLCSKQFLLNVDSTIVDDEAIESTNEFTALVDALGRVNNIDSRFEEVDLQLEHKANEVDLDIERKRINSFTRLQEGSTTGDAELIDARISDDGIESSTLGENIRTNFKYIKNNIDGNVDLYCSGNKPLTLMLKNAKLNLTGIEEKDNVIAITNFMSFTHDEEFTCEIGNAYFDIFVYDSDRTFENKIAYGKNDNVKITFNNSKLYRFQITPSNWTTVVTNNNYTSYIINGKLKINSDFIDNKLNALKDEIVAGKSKLNFNWTSGKFNTDSGEFEDASDYIRTEKLMFNDNETITFGCTGEVSYYYFIQEYNLNDNSSNCIVNTKKNGSFMTKPNCQYVFAVWYGGTNFDPFYEINLIECTITFESIKNLQIDSKDNVYLDFPNDLYIKKGDILEIFKYGTYYTDKPYLENEYNVRILNIDKYVKNYSHKIVINCPSDYIGDTITGTYDKPLIQLLNKYGEVVESKRFTIHVVGTPTKTLNVAYFGDSWTGMAFRTKKTAELISGTNIKLIGKFQGDGVGNKFTGTGGYAWDNFVDNPNTLPSSYPNNYLWDSTTNDISFTKFMNEYGSGGNLDVAVVLLGWNDKENGAFAGNFSMDKIKTKCKYFIEKLHSEYPNCKIILESYTYGYPFYRSSYASTMPQVLHNKYIYELNKLYKNISDEYLYVDFLQLSCHADVFYNMPFEYINANKYSSEKIKCCNDDAHLSDIGYYQCSEAETNVIMYYAQ